MNKLLTFLLIGLFLFSLTSVSAFIDSKESIDLKVGDKYTLGERQIDYKEIWKEYKPIEITTWFGLGTTIFKGALTEHTSTCGGELACNSTMEIYLDKKSILIEEMIFERSFDDGKTWVRWNGFVNWRVQVENKNRYIDQPIYETRCEETGKTTLNGTKETICSQIEIGKEKVDTGEFIPYQIGTEVEAGNYKIQILSNKKKSTLIDWKIKTQGKILHELAIWGSIAGGDEAEIIINSPANNSISLVNSVVFNTTANISVEAGAYLTNASLNLSVNGGAWEIRNTTDLSGSGLVSYYTLDETSGTTAYDSVGSNDGTNSGATINQAGKIDKAYLFSSAEEKYITLPFKPATTCSINFWIYPTGAGGYTGSGDSKSSGKAGWEGTYDSINEKIYMDFWTNNKLSGGVSSTDNSVPLNQWSMGTITISGTSVKMFVNGNLESSTTLSEPSDIHSLNLKIGRNFISGGGANTLSGKIDEYSYWNRSLTQSEITALYNSGAGSRTTTTTTTTTTFTNTFNAGDVIDWNMKFCDSDGDCGQSETRRFTIDGTAPTINLSYPTALIDYGRLNGTLQLNFTATDSNLDSVWYNYNGTNVSMITNSQNNSAILDNFTTTSFVKLDEIRTNQLVHNMSSELRSTSAGNGKEVQQVIVYKDGTNVSQTNATTIVTFTEFVFINPNPTKIVDRVEWWAREVSTTGRGEVINRVVNVQSNPFISEITLSTKKNVTICALDQVGNENCQTIGWDYKVFENSRSFTTPIVETSLDTFIINVTSGLSLSSVYLNYNGTEYPTSLSGGVYTKQLTIPAITQDSTMQVSWRFVYDGTNITSDITNQTISKLIFNICNATINNTLINFTTKSATNPFPIVNSTFKSSWMLSASIRATPTNFTYEDIDGNKSSYAFCTNTNTTTIYTDAEVEYDGTGYALNFYYLDNINLTATSPQNISLYLLNDSLATVTILKVVSASQQPQPEHRINIQSYDVGTGTFYLVGMAKTNFNGEDVVYLNWFDTLYKFIVLDEDGEVVKTTGTTKISASPTIIELENEITFPYDKFEDFVYSLYYDNATSNFVLTYTKPSGEVDKACLRVYKHGSGNDTLVCDECETSASATLFCNVASYGNGTYVALFYATGSFSLVDWIYEYVGGTFQTTIYNLLGNEDASFYAFLFAGLITVALFINAVFGIIALMIGLIGASALGFTALQWGQMTGVIIIGGFIVWLLKR